MTCLKLANFIFACLEFQHHGLVVCLQIRCAFEFQNGGLILGSCERHLTRFSSLYQCVKWVLSCVCWIFSIEHSSSEVINVALPRVFVSSVLNWNVSISLGKVSTSISPSPHPTLTPAKYPYLLGYTWNTFKSLEFIVRRNEERQVFGDI